jgi:hypothetical protein
MAHPDDDLANLGSFLEHSAAGRPGHPAIRLDDFVLSYDELRDAAGTSGFPAFYTRLDEQAAQA